MGQAREAVTIQHEAAKSPRIVRISKRVRVAVDTMVLEGLKRSDAAKKAGLTDNALYIALRKPEVLAYMNSQMGVLRRSEAARTVARAVSLADDAESEHVRLEANKWIAGLEGVQPIQRTENVHVHQHLIPGLTIVRGAWQPHGDDPRVIEGQAREPGLHHKINRIGTPVPHPEARNALLDVPEIAGESQAGRADTRGEK